MQNLTSSIINCTPHEIKVYNQEKTEVIASYPRSDYQPRLAEEAQVKIGSIQTPDGKTIPVVSAPKYSEVTGLPSFDDGKCPDIIVSMLVGKKLKETGQWKGGVYGPDTGLGVVRDETGRIQGTTQLIQYCASQALNTI